MGLFRLSLTPGINSQQSQTLNRGGWWAGNLIRWRDGLPEKVGGWQKLFQTALAGVARAIHAWEDLSTAINMLFGTSAGPEVYTATLAAPDAGTLTPLGLVRRTIGVISATQMSVTLGSTTVQVVDPSSFTAVGDQVVILMATSVGGRIIPANTTVTVATVISADSWTFNMTYPALSSGLATVPHFVLSPGQALQTIKFPAHGYLVGDMFPVDQTTSYNLVTLTGTINFTIEAGTFLTVTNVIDANNFQFVGGPYSSNWTGTGTQEIFEGTNNSSGVFTFGNWYAYVITAPAGDPQWYLDNLGQTGLLVYTPSPLFVYNTPLGGAYAGRTTASTIGAQSGILYPGLVLEPVLTTVGGIGSPLINVNQSSHGYSLGNTVRFNVHTTIGGRTLVTGTNVTVTSVVDANNFRFNMASNALNTNNGASPLFSINATGTVQTVTLPSHGLVTGNSFTFELLTHYDAVIGSASVNFDLPASTVVVTVVDPNTFTFVGGPYSSTWPAVPIVIAEGYNVVAGVIATLPIWFNAVNTIPTMQQTWLGLLPDIYSVGLSPLGVIGANPITAPQLNNGMFVAMPQAQVIVFGTEAVFGSGIIDPLLTRFSDAGSYTDWTASATNQAGSYRLSRGSKIVGGIQAPQTTLLFTDVDLWTMAYVGPPFVYSFTILQTGCGMIAPKACAVLGRTTIWMGKKNFFAFSEGGVKTLQCPIWDIIFNDINDEFVDRIHLGANSAFHEIIGWWVSESGGGTEIDRAFKVNVITGEWDYADAQYARTAWIDESVFGNAIGATPGLHVMEHEVGYDNDGLAMTNVFLESGYSDYADGGIIPCITEFIPDFKWFGTYPIIAVTFKSQKYPGELPYVKGPYYMDSTNRHIRPRVRGRQIAMRLDWPERVGYNARLGAPRIRVASDGTRP